jgi:hypothetical protein
MTDFTFPLMTILNTGNVAVDEPFNFFFSLMAGVGILLFIPWVLFHLLGESL